MVHVKKGYLENRSDLRWTDHSATVLLLGYFLKKVINCVIGSVQAPLMWEDVPPAAALSPLWEADVRRNVVTTKLSEHALNQRRSKLLVPGGYCPSFFFF